MAMDIMYHVQYSSIYLSEEHLLMHSQQTNDWTIVVMVEFHAKKDHRNLHIGIKQIEETQRTRMRSMDTRRLTVQ